MTVSGQYDRTTRSRHRTGMLHENRDSRRLSGHGRSAHMLRSHPPPRRDALSHAGEGFRRAGRAPARCRYHRRHSRAGGISPARCIERLPKLKLLALVGRGASTIDFAACTEHGIPVSTGKSNSPDAPAELAIALIVASRRNVALEAERMRRGDWPCTLSHRLRGSTLGILALGAIGTLVAQAGRGLGMNVLVWGREKSLEKAQGGRLRRSPPARPNCSSARMCCPYTRG